jgi:hypothetical protein
VAAVGLKTGGEQVERAAQLAEPMLLAFLARRAPDTHYTLGAGSATSSCGARASTCMPPAPPSPSAAQLSPATTCGRKRADSDVARLTAEAAQYDQRYRNVMAEMPPRVTSTANMRAAVTVERMLATQSATPLGMATVISQALETAPQIRLLQLDWKVTCRRQRAGAGQEDNAAAPMSSLVAGIPAGAAIAAAGSGNPRRGRRLSRRGRQHEPVRASAGQASAPDGGVDKPPVDTRSTVKLAGKAARRRRRPRRASP